MESRPSELVPSTENTRLGLPDVSDAVTEPITGVAFWSAVALPFLHLPLLIATGLSSRSTTTAFLVLLGLNVLALLVGHPHSHE